MHQQKFLLLKDTSIDNMFYFGIIALD